MVMVMMMVMMIRSLKDTQRSRRRCQAPAREIKKEINEKLLLDTNN